MTQRAQTGSGAALRSGRRNVAIDTLRGVAVVLMVAGHVVGTTKAEGMMVSADSAWRVSYILLADLRLPLFTALSGFVYGFRPINAPARLPQFLKGKARRLLIPLVTVGTSFALLQSVVPGTNNTWDLHNLWQVYVYGLWHFWFLQSIFILLIGLGVANAFGWLKSSRSVAMAIGVLAFVNLSVHVPDPYAVFSINGVIRLAPFFLLGYGLSCIWPHLRGRPLILTAALVLFVLRSAETLLHIDLPSHVSAALGLAVGLTGITSLLLYRDRLRWWLLARLGYFSFGIYLLHVFGVAPTRILLDRLGLGTGAVEFLLCLVAGLALPVLFEVTFGRVKWISWAFLGQRPYRAVPES